MGHRLDPYEEAKAQLRESLDILGYPEEYFEALAVPERVIQLKLLVRMDDGSTRTFIGWRSQHNSALGPYKGGVRYHPDTTMNEVIALSMWMTWKNSLAGLPYGGGKGGIRVDPRRLSRGELERLSRVYFEALSEFVGVDVDIPAPDVYTNPQVMAWYYDQYSRIKKGSFFGVVTGKPVEIGGLRARVVSTGLGVAVAAREAASRVLGGIEGARVAVQGFGNVGYYASKFLSEMGASIVAVSDSRGGIYSSKGLAIDEVSKVKQATGSVVNYKGAEKLLASSEVLELDVDILVPAAIENVITEENAERIKARIIVEGANGPTTKEGEEILTKRGVLIVPDILANAGGVIMSHIEWVNNRMGGWISEDEAKNKLVEKVRTMFNSVWDYYESKIDRDKHNMRAAAYTIAVDRVVRAMKLRGWL